MFKYNKPNKYECPICSKQFRVWYNLMNHLAKDHRIFRKEFNETYMKFENEKGEVWYEKLSQKNNNDTFKYYPTLK